MTGVPIFEGDDCHTSLVAGVSVPITSIITSIISAIISSIVMYLCCIKRNSPSIPPVTAAPVDYEIPVTAAVNVQSNSAYGHFNTRSFVINNAAVAVTL